jgi:hypothetical protein
MAGDVQSSTRNGIIGAAVTGASVSDAQRPCSAHLRLTILPLILWPEGPEEKP